MVKLCSDIAYPEDREDHYKSHFETFSFPLSPFQKHSIEAIVEGQHALVAVPTGSGKSLPAEFAIQYLTGKGKKVIYTCPIKALSNQKYNEFTRKYPHITFGVITGDLKLNEQADVLIMTTEILQNTLYRKKQKTASLAPTASMSLAPTASPSLAPLNLAFDMDIENDLGCIIHDEVHYIADADRGRAWEECFMMTPPHVQYVLLSATLDSPEKFAGWVESFGHKEVYLTISNHRIVPLIHYQFITCTQAIFKKIKDKDLEKQIRDVINRPHVIMTAKKEFQEPTYHKIQKYLDLFEQKQVYMKRSFVMNEVCKYMVENNLLPAVFFIMSKKQIQVAVKEITVPLLEDDSKTSYIIRRECETIIRSKLSNYAEYLELPEYIELVALLEKGIAYHHSGILPILREMVEVLFEKGYIKLLFATETIAIGLNMPIKTVIFTDLKKFDGTKNSVFLPSAYQQCSGRSGRRSIDTVGTVIHLNNLFSKVDLTEYRQMMCGKPQRLTSKFKVSYHLILNLLDQQQANASTNAVSLENRLVDFCKKSMIQEDIESHMSSMKIQIDELNERIATIEMATQCMRTPIDQVRRYIECIESRKTSVNKRRKELDREIEQFTDTYRHIASDVITVQKMNMIHEERKQLIRHYDDTSHYFQDMTEQMVHFLKSDGQIISPIQVEDRGPAQVEDRALDPDLAQEPIQDQYILSQRGNMAVHLREIHGLAFAKMIEKEEFRKISAKQLVAIFSCFTNVTVSEELQTLYPNSNDKAVTKTVKELVELYSYYQDYESQNQMDTGMDYMIHYDLIDYVMEWCDCETASDCKYLLQRLELEKGIFLGEFVKAIMKINNISSEMERVAEMSGNVEWLHTLTQIPKMTLKFVATNQSLYV